MKRITVLLSLALLFAATASADETIPPTPKPTKSPQPAATTEATLNINFTSVDKKARLVIPRSQLKQLRAELEGLDDNGETVATVSRFSRAQTITSGLFLSLAIVFGGVWFVRSGKSASKKGKILAGGALLFFGGAFASIVFGNIGPPLRTEITSRIFNQDYFSHPLGIEGKVTLEISDRDERIRLYVPEVKDEKSK